MGDKIVVSYSGLLTLKAALIQAGVKARESMSSLSPHGAFSASQSQTANGYCQVISMLSRCTSEMDHACTSLARYMATIVETMEEWDQEYARIVAERTK